MNDCIFCKIANREITPEILYEDDMVMAFRDIHPKKPVHILIIPKKHIENIMALDDDQVLNGVREAVKHLVHLHELEGKGFKIEINGGGLQDVEHLHVHLMGPYK